MKDLYSAYCIPIFSCLFSTKAHFLSLSTVVHNQQCKSDISAPKATDKELQGLRQILQHLWQKPARPISLLLPFLQGSFALKPEILSLTHAFSILSHSYFNFSRLGLSQFSPFLNSLTPISIFHFSHLGLSHFGTISLCFFLSQIDYLIRTNGGISEYLFDCKTLTLPEPGLDDGFMTPDSVLEPAGSSRTSSGSGGCGGVDCRTVACTATTEIVRKKRSSLSSAYRAVCRPVCSPVSEISASLMNRRKGTPQRAPLYWISVRIGNGRGLWDEFGVIFFPWG